MSPPPDGPSDAKPDCGCKVGTVAARFGLEPVVAEFAREWQTESTGVRPLTDRFNQQVIAQAIDRTDLDVYDTESVYEVLGGEVGSAGERTDLEGALSQAGIDVAELTDAIISHQTLYRHLTDCLGVEPDDGTTAVETQLERAIETTRRLEGRTTQVVADRLDQLAAAGGVTLGEYEVFTDVEVLCTDCSQVLSFEELLDRGGCDCH